MIVRHDVVERRRPLFSVRRLRLGLRHEFRRQSYTHGSQGSNVCAQMLSTDRISERLTVDEALDFIDDCVFAQGRPRLLHDAGF